MMAVAWRIKVTKENKRYYKDIDDLSLYFIGAITLPLALNVLIYIKNTISFSLHFPSAVSAVLVSKFLVYKCKVLTNM